MILPVILFTIYHLSKKVSQIPTKRPLELPGLLLPLPILFVLTNLTKDIVTLNVVLGLVSTRL